jgi:diaminopimelate epimerase
MDNCGLNYYIIYPSGNTTAVVVDKIHHEIDYKRINDIIMEKHKNVEQVCFLLSFESNTNLCLFRMAGGEFCGNASRAIGFLCSHLYNLSKMKININNLFFEFEKDGKNGAIIIETKKLVEKIETLEKDTYLVSMNGVSHIVIRKNSPHFLQFPDQNKVRKLMIELDIRVKDALGILMLDDELNMKPFVYVVGIDTFFYETACGSGTIACACVLNEADHRIKFFQIRQPSNEILTCEFINNKIKLDGIVTILDSFNESN